MKGADITIKDARGNDALGDAKRENRTAIVDYLINEAMVRNYCTDFEDGIFSKGMLSAIGVF
jgi:ankyrin repeat protein